MRENQEPIGRPRQVYTGYTERKYMSILKTDNFLLILKKRKSSRLPFLFLQCLIKVYINVFQIYLKMEK